MEDLSFDFEREFVPDLGRLMVKSVYHEDETMGRVLITSELLFVCRSQTQDTGENKWDYCCIAGRDYRDNGVDWGIKYITNYNPVAGDPTECKTCVTHMYATENDLISFIGLLGGHKDDEHYVKTWLESLYALEDLNQEEKSRLREIMEKTFYLQM